MRAALWRTALHQGLPEKRGIPLFPAELCGQENRPGFPGLSCAARQEPVAAARPFRASLPAQAYKRCVSPSQAQAQWLQETPLCHYGDGFAGELHPCSCVRPRSPSVGTRSPSGHNHTLFGGFCQTDRSLPPVPDFAPLAHREGPPANRQPFLLYFSVIHLFCQGYKQPSHPRFRRVWKKACKSALLSAS